jgi:hypothetical protein
VHPLAAAALAKPWAGCFTPFIRPCDKLPASGKKNFAGLSNVRGDHYISRSRQWNKDGVSIEVAQAVTSGDKFFDKDSVFNNSILWQRGYHTNLLQVIRLYLNTTAASYKLPANNSLAALSIAICHQRSYIIVITISKEQADHY